MQALFSYLNRYQLVAMASYIAVVAICLVVSWGALADIHDHYAALAATTDILDQIEGRKGSASHPALGAPSGSPFLEGRSVTIAAAALQQRVTGAVGKAGGNVLSTQIDLNSAQAKSGFINLIVSCEVKQAALQQLLYDLEAGMPFLFVEQLEVQVPQATGQEDAAMRVLITVSGQWQGKS
jgi:general secretion pathway protein M